MTKAIIMFILLENQRTPALEFAFTRSCIRYDVIFRYKDQIHALIQEYNQKHHYSGKSTSPLVTANYKRVGPPAAVITTSPFESLLTVLGKEAPSTLNVQESYQLCSDDLRNGAVVTLALLTDSVILLCVKGTDVVREMLML